mmetsp:Transcript_30539/g.87247  ORF Transcript_30539/g.87247 Transcript_30539/m.87247 type:complete len:227 (-) Transcript_30539:329-1009(-)
MASSRKRGDKVSAWRLKPSKSARKRPSCNSALTCCSLTRRSTALTAPSSCSNHGGGPALRAAKRPCTCSSTRFRCWSCWLKARSFCSTREAVWLRPTAISSTCCRISRISASLSNCFARHSACASAMEVLKWERSSRSLRSKLRSVTKTPSMRRSWATKRSSAATKRASSAVTRSSRRADTSSSWCSISCLSVSLLRCKPATSCEIRSANCPTFWSTNGTAAPYPA